MNGKFISSLVFLSLFAGCAGGGVDGSGAANQQYASDALVQMLEYETFRNMMVSGLKLQTNGDAIEYLDTNSRVFGGPSADGTTRSLKASPTRMKAAFIFANLACEEAIENQEEELFPAGANGENICKQIRGRPVDADEKATMSEITKAPNLKNEVQIKHALCVFCVAGIKTSLK